MTSLRHRFYFLCGTGGAGEEVLGLRIYHVYSAYCCVLRIWWFPMAAIMVRIFCKGS